MKVRGDFVTNSSSSSYIICFARIADTEKAQKIIDKYEADWCGATIYNVDDIITAHPDDKFIIIEDSNDAIEDEWGDADYDYDFSMNKAIDKITEKNGFADIEVAQGEGRNG